MPRTGPRKPYKRKPITDQERFARRVNLAWLRFHHQCRFRREESTLTRADYFRIWANEEDFNRRGRLNDDLVLTRLDREKPWGLGNVCIITRYNQLLINRAIRDSRSVEPFLKDARIF